MDTSVDDIRFKKVALVVMNPVTDFAIETSRYLPPLCDNDVQRGRDFRVPCLSRESNAITKKGSVNQWQKAH